MPISGYEYTYMSGPRPKNGRIAEFIVGSTIGTSHCVASLIEDSQILSLPVNPPCTLVVISVELLNDAPILIRRCWRVWLLDVGIKIMGKANSPDVSNISADFMVSRFENSAKLMLNKATIDNATAINGPRPDAK